MQGSGIRVQGLGIRVFFREVFRAAAWSARALAPTQKASAMPASPKYISNVFFLGRCG